MKYRNQVYENITLKKKQINSYQIQVDGKRISNNPTRRGSQPDTAGFGVIRWYFSFWGSDNLGYVVVLK